MSRSSFLVAPPVRVRALFLVVSLAFPAVVAAQQVGDNVNVLPVYKTLQCSKDATGAVTCQWTGMADATVRAADALRGNLYGQRLNEPSILVSSRNKDHIMVFFNDYRAVDEAVDQPIPSTTKNSAFAAIWNGVKTFFAKLTGRPTEIGQPGEEDHAANQQAGLGCSVSYDGGITWTGCFVPGLPFDQSAASLVSPSYAKGLQGMSDPTVAAGKCGKGYLANVAFTFSQASQLQVHTVQDMNDSDVRHTWEWKYIADVSDCNNSSWGCFVDKPAIAAVPIPTASCGDAATDKIYTTFTTFTGTTGTGSTKFQSKVNLAVSTDGGKTFSTQLVDGNYTSVQGTDIEVSRSDTSYDPAGTVFVVFRTFASPNSIILRRSTTSGSGWAKPIDILALGDPAHPFLQTYDQPTIDISSGDPNKLTFRSNAFPAAAMTPDGKILIVTFQEKANATGDPCPVLNGVVDAACSATAIPRIMMTYSKDGGRSWSPRKAISYTSNRPEATGLGFFSPLLSAAGPQVQPAIACSTNSTCLVTWMESKEALSTGTGWMSGYLRRMNHRAMSLMIDPATGNPVVSPATSVQVSRYSYDDDQQAATDADSEVEKISVPWASGVTFPMWNYFNFNNYSSGTSPFDGDYTDVRALTPDTFITAFTDNRYVVQPTTFKTSTGSFIIDAAHPWLNFPNYSPWPQCDNQNPGSRAQTVMTAQISNGFVVTTPANYKNFSTTTAPVACGATLQADGTWTLPNQQCVEFPFTAWNNTSSEKKYRMWLSGAVPALPPAASTASFAKDINAAAYTYPLKDGGLDIFQHSSNSANVYVFDASPVTVNIAECPSWTVNTATGGTTQVLSCTRLNPDGTPVLDANGRPVYWAPASLAGITASVTFNAPASAPSSVATSTFSLTPSAVTVSGRNVSGRNVSGRNVSGRNVSGRNVSGRNSLPPDTTVYNVTDYSVNVTPTTQGDAGSYLSLFNVDEAYSNDYIFQVLVTKPLTSFTTVGTGCALEPFNSTDGALVSQATVSGRNVSGRNVSGRNVSGRNPVPIDGDPLAQTIQNTSFTLGSSVKDLLPLPGSTGSTTTGCTNGPWGRIGECTQAAPRLPNTVTVTLRAYQINPTASLTRTFDPNVAPPAIGVADYACKGDACLLGSTGPDLAVPVPPPAPATAVSPSVVPAGAVVTFPTASVRVTNIGKNCADGDPLCGTAGPHRWGVYLSTAATPALLPRYKAGDPCADPSRCAPGMIKENLTDFTQPVTTLLSLGSGQAATGVLPQLVIDPAKDSSGNPIPCGTSGASCVDVASQSVRIPATIPRRNANGTGTYYAYLYIDDQRVVSELNEDNNIIQGGPITVQAPGYGFLGLQTPCSGTSCTKNGTLPLAWQFTSGGVPVDTSSDLPRLKFYASCPAPLGSDGYPIGTVLASSSPNAADLTSGNSGWQYFPNPGMSRPQFSWQYNFDSSGLPRGTCYSMYVEVPSTGQVIGAADPRFKPFGPFLITPQ